jgi:hypothetical protein
MMAVEIPEGDLTRVHSSEPDRSWPLLVQIVVAWKLDNGQIVHRTQTILGDEFYGRASFGAPMPGDALIGAVETLRRMGPPEQPQAKKRKSARPASLQGDGYISLQTALRQPLRPKPKKRMR